MFPIFVIFLVTFINTFAKGVPLSDNSTVTCTENETFTDCLDPCTPTCGIPYEQHCEFLVCNDGCLCNEGYKKATTSMSECVPIDTCQEYCKPYQIYNKCGSPCPPTCQNPNPVCENTCSPGCYCKEGYIFDEVFELCVSRCVW